MNQLRKDYRFLNKKGISKPSQLNVKNYVDYDIEVIETVTRYKHLLLNKLFLEKNGMSFEKTDKKMPTGINNGKKVVGSESENKGIQGVKSDIISYPLSQIFLYIEENFDKLEGDNKKQIEVAEKFNIKNLGIFSRIIKGLGLDKKLGWIGINLPIEKFKNLILEIEKLEETKDEITGKDIIEIGIKLDINNPENLYTGISALGITKKYGIKKLSINNNKKVKIILSYVELKYGDSKVAPPFDRTKVFDLIKHFEYILSKNEKERIRNITSFLRFFGYTVLDIRDFSGLKAPIKQVEAPYFF